MECSIIQGVSKRALQLDMLQEFLIPQLDEDDQEGRIHFQQDGAPPSLPWRSARVPQHPFPRSVDR